MKISVRWLNEYLDPANVTAEGAEQALTAAGFPIEEAVQLSDGDVMLDVEVTSNRGDCLSHIGVAREIAAVTDRKFRLPTVPEVGKVSGAEASSLVKLDNRTPDVCSLFTLRVIRGVQVGPSPEWLARSLVAVGQRPINNVVDATNYVMFEYGQPSHVFDMAKVAAGAGGIPEIAVRYASNGEKLTLLDGKRVELRSGELVVADANGPLSLAGIMGGLGSEVTIATTDVLLEAATWDPLTVRRAARRMQLATDASYRFERRVDPRTIDIASRRVADIILRTGGPEARLVSGVVQSGAEMLPLTRVSMRPARCRAVLGMNLPTTDVVKALRAHDIQLATPSAGDDASLECTIPAHRPDLEREIDLIEEVARTIGLECIPTLDMLSVRVSAPQVRERASRELAGALNGLGFFETITFSFVSPAQAAPFLPGSGELEMMQLCDDRRKADPVLRPSVIPSLLACRATNQNAGVQSDAGIRLYETSSTFAQVSTAAGKSDAGAARQRAASGKEVETRVLALYADAVTPSGASKGFDARQEAFRLMRGVIESVTRTLGGPNASVRFHAGDLPIAGLDPAGAARVELINARGERKFIGACGLITPAVLKAYDLATPAVVAELSLLDLLALFPPRSVATPLPLFPGIERDLSFIVPENVAWGALDALVGEARLERLDGWEFVTAYRGVYRDAANAEHNLAKQQKKAVTLRLRFRDPARTLRHEEVDPQVATLVQLAASKFGAQVRM